MRLLRNEPRDVARTNEPGEAARIASGSRDAKKSTAAGSPSTARIDASAPSPAPRTPGLAPRAPSIASAHRSGYGVLQSLARPVAAAALGAMLVATPVLGAPLEKQPASDAGRWTVTTTYAGDTNLSKGQTDAFGDLKDLRFVARKDGVVIATEAAMITPERAADGAQRDTGLMGLTVGRETDLGGAYLTVGQLGGFASDALYGAIDLAHASQGMGPSRKSPPSADAQIYAAISGRLDHQLDLVDVGSAALRLEGTAHATLGTLERSAGAEVLLALEAKDTTFEPTIPGLPAKALRGPVLYVGVAGKAIEHDVVTDALGTEPFQASLVAGAGINLGPNVSIGAEYRRPLLPEVRGTNAKPISTFAVTLNVSF